MLLFFNWHVWPLFCASSTHLDSSRLGPCIGQCWNYYSSSTYKDSSKELLSIGRRHQIIFTNQHIYMTAGDPFPLDKITAWFVSKFLMFMWVGALWCRLHLLVSRKRYSLHSPYVNCNPVLFFRPQIFDEYLSKSERGRANVVPFSLLNLFDID